MDTDLIIELHHNGLYYTISPLIHMVKYSHRSLRGGGERERENSVVFKWQSLLNKSGLSLAEVGGNNLTNCESRETVIRNCPFSYNPLWKLSNDRTIFIIFNTNSF